MSPRSPQSDSGTHSSSGRGGLTGIRRTRPSYSCEACRRRRVKCDQVHPTCGSCSKMNASCAYPPVNLKRRDGGSHSCSSHGQRVSRKRVMHDATHAKGGYLSLQSGGRSRFIENTFWASVDPESLDLDSLIFELPLVQTENPDHDCGAEDHDSATGSCRNCPANGDGNFSFYFSQYPSLVKNDCQNLSGVLHALPSREICDDLYRNFLCSVHPLIPLIHTPTFDQQYRRFWSWYQSWNATDIPSGVLAETPSFLALLLAILFTGSVAGPHAGMEGTSASSPQYATMQKRLCSLTSRTLSMVGFPQNPAMASLEAYLLLQSILIREEEAVSSCSFVAVALRIAQAMGLHRDPADFGLDPVQCEERRRVWCYLMHLDVMTSFVSGLPMMISEGMYTTGPIGELRDEYLGDLSSTDLDGSERLHPGYVLGVGRYEISGCIREILNLHTSPIAFHHRDLDPIKEKIEDLRRRTEDRIGRLTEITSRKSWLSDVLAVTAVPTAYPVDDEVFAGWSAHILRLQIERAYTLLYQPLMQDKQIWSAIRAEAIPHYQSFLQIFNELINTSKYSAFHWLYPGTYQPLNPVSILLVDLLRAPTADEAVASRLALEPIFASMGPHGRVFGRSANGDASTPSKQMSHGARIAWSRLEALRKKVWRRLGIDTVVMWEQNSHTNTSGSPHFASAEAKPFRHSPTLQSASISETFSIDMDFASQNSSESPSQIMFANASFAFDNFGGPAAGMSLDNFAPTDLSWVGIMSDQSLATWPSYMGDMAARDSNIMGDFDWQQNGRIKAVQ